MHPKAPSTRAGERPTFARPDAESQGGSEFPWETHAHTASHRSLLSEHTCVGSSKNSWPEVSPDRAKASGRQATPTFASIPNPGTTRPRTTFPFRVLRGIGAGSDVTAVGEGLYYRHPSPELPDAGSRLRSPGFASRIGLGLGIALLFCMAGCDALVSSLPEDPRGGLRQVLPSIRTDAGMTGRSALTLATGLCVLQHFPPFPDQSPELGELDRPSPHDIDAGKSAMRLLPYGHVTTFNCATFALADELDLKPTDWVEPFARAATFYTDPAQIALDSRYDQIVEFHYREQDQDAMVGDGRVQSGDVICYRRTLDERKVIVHMGRLVRAEEGWLVYSKLGIGPIVVTSVEFGAEHFEGPLISIYRPKSETGGH